MRRPGDRLRQVFLTGASGVLVAFFVVTIAALIVTMPLAAVPTALADPTVTRALAVSLGTSVISMSIVVALGTPLAWLLARRRTRSTGWMETALQLPEAIPPAVAGLSLLLAFGRNGLLGRPLAALGVNLAFSTTAVVLAQIFVGGPFFVQAATAAFRRIDDDLLGVARSLGAGPLRTFARVTLPLCAPGLLGGLALGWARALGEFGATLMFAGNLTGRTQTLPLAVYTALESDLATAQVIAVILLALALLMLLLVRWVVPSHLRAVVATSADPATDRRGS